MNTNSITLTPQLLQQMEAYWRAANHLSVRPGPGYLLTGQVL